MRTFTSVVAGVIAAGSAIGSLLVLEACTDEHVLGPEKKDDDVAALIAIVSDPVSAAGVSQSVRSSAVASADQFTFVSLPPGSIPAGEVAVIRHSRNSSTVRTVVVDGGFDPVPVVASTGDTLDLEIISMDSSFHLLLLVPITRKPVVVRTSPPRGKRDVVLNARPVIVFSEPILAASVTASSVELLHGNAPVSGRPVLTIDGLRAEFHPDQPLAPNTDYVLSVASGVRDLRGDALAQPVRAEFTTGTTTAVATIGTDPAALFTVNGQLRTFEFSAILHDDGRVTGSYSGANPAWGTWVRGRITCFTILNGRAAWIGGHYEAASFDTTGWDIGWRAVDNGPRGSPVPDQLSFTWGIDRDSIYPPSGFYGTAQEFCDETPEKGLNPLPAWPDPLHNVEIGDIRISGSTPTRAASTGGRRGQPQRDARH